MTDTTNNAWEGPAYEYGLTWGPDAVDTTDQQAVTVVQEDREAAGRFYGYDDEKDIAYWGNASAHRDVERLAELLARHRLASVSSASAEGRVKLPPEIAEHVLSLGRVEWGQTPAHGAEGHAAHVADSVRLTAQHFGQTGDQHMHGLWLAGTETVLCHTGTSPNAPKTTQALVGAWNWLVDQASASPEPVPATNQAGEVDIPVGMKLWTGGDGAPVDWDGGPVLRRHGGLSMPDGQFAWSSNAGGLGNIIAYRSKSGLPTPHPLGFYNPPESFYADQVPAFENAHPFTSHEKARKPDGSLEDWGRVGYHHSHVDATFDGWVKGRYSLTPIAVTQAAKPQVDPRGEFGLAARGYGRAGTADMPDGPYMSMDDAADVHASLIATQPATSQEGNQSGIPTSSLAATSQEGEAIDRVAKAIYEAGGSFVDQNGFIAWADLDGSNDAENFRKMALAALAATPTPPTLSEDLREVIARTLYLRRNPSEYSSNDSYQWQIARGLDLSGYYADADAILTKIPGFAVLSSDLEWFDTQRRLSLSFCSPMYGDDDDQSEEWRVHKESGPINDREWDVIGRGRTVAEAIAAARAALTQVKAS